MASYAIVLVPRKSTCTVAPHAGLGSQLTRLPCCSRRRSCRRLLLRQEGKIQCARTLRLLGHLPLQARLQPRSRRGFDRIDPSQHAGNVRDICVTLQTVATS